MIRFEKCSSYLMSGTQLIVDDGKLYREGGAEDDPNSAQCDATDRRLGQR